MVGRRRILTLNAESIGNALLQVTLSARRIVESRVGPRALAPVDMAVSRLRRGLAPAAGRFYQWCEAAPAANPKRSKRKKHDGPESAPA